MLLSDTYTFSIILYFPYGLGIKESKVIYVCIHMVYKMILPARFIIDFSTLYFSHLFMHAYLDCNR